MLQTQLVGHEVIVLGTIAFVCICAFIFVIWTISHNAAKAALHKKIAEDNAKAFKEIRKADKIILTDVSNSDVVRELRGGRY